MQDREGEKIIIWRWKAEGESGEERGGGGDSFTATQLSYLQGVEKPFFFFLLQEDEKILLKPTGSAIIFGQLEH